MELTLDQFVTIAQESGLLSHGHLDAVLQTRGEGSHVDAPSLADALVEKGSLTSWQADKLLSGVQKGFFLSQYKLLRLIASGSMSSVYEAEHIGLRRKVALKVLPKGLLGEASFLERFYREAQTVARLDHPNIIRGFDVGQDGDYHFFVMEFLKGHTLEDMVEKSGPLSFEAAANLIRQSSLGLQHAHEAGLVHRDIKPANLFLDLEGTLKILDLGLVRSLSMENDKEAGLTRLHDECVLGTVDYLSPEQAIDSHEVDTRSDIYSLGCTLFYLLTGTPPFAKGTLAERLLAHQTKAPSPLSVLRPDIPRGLSLIVNKMLAKRPEDRYQVPAEVATALADWLRSREAAQSSRPIEAPNSSALKASTRKKGSSVRTSKQPSVAKAEKKSSSIARPAQSHAAESPRRSGPIDREDLPLVLAIPELAACWERWAKVVESLASGSILRSSIGDAAYKQLYEELRHVCRVSAVDADEPTLKVLRQIEDLIAPWMTLRSLKTALQSEMSQSIIRRFGEVDKTIRVRRKRKPLGGRPMKLIASFALIFVGFSLLAAYQPGLMDPKAAMSAITEARLSLKKLTHSTIDYVYQKQNQ